MRAIFDGSLYGFRLFKLAPLAAGMTERVKESKKGKADNLSL